MLRRLVLGLSAAGLVGGSAVGQFAADRSPQKAAPAPFGGVGPTGAPAAPGGVRPAGGYVPPVGGFTPANTTPPPSAPLTAPGAATPAEPVAIPTALGPDHPLALKPEHGAFLILLRSYSRPARPDPANPGMTARELAEALAGEVRRLPQAKGLNVYLYEHISEERRSEALAQAEARRKAAEFKAAMEGYRQKSQLNGMEFLAPDVKLRYQSFNYRDQIGVMVGGFATEQEAVRALAKVKTWPVPADTRLLDGAAIARAGKDGKGTIEKSFLNPYGQAMVVANPTTPKVLVPAGSVAALDPFIVRLNEGRPYNLLKASKTWTLGVKAFNAPVKVQSRDDDGVGVKTFGLTRTGDVLNAGAAQAEQLAKALRELRGPAPDHRPLGLEAFVLHHRHGSIVTVGQFDGPTDPAMTETRRLLMGLNFITRDPQADSRLLNTGTDTNQPILPIPIPK